MRRFPSTNGGASGQQSGHVTDAVPDHLTAPFGELLRQHRHTHGWTQAELAERAHLSARGVNDLERGARRTPRRDTVSLLADALELVGDAREAFLAAARPPRRLRTRRPLALVPELAANAPVQPSGTVTFLFTDIEGSTRLLRQLGDGYPAVLEAHYRLLRAAFAAHHGYEVDTQGDSFFVAFPTARDALSAAVAAQRAVAAHPWPAGSAVRVRMGLHTGSPTLVGDQYVGLDVHRAARIGAAAHGGQILLAETTHALVRSATSDGVELRDLGAHRLKDLGAPERLWQVVIAGLPDRFPPPQTLDRHDHNLPSQPTALIGREEVVRQVVTLLRSRATRLLTLTGTGGTGKSRLSLQVAAELVGARSTNADAADNLYPDGVWFVRLSRLSNAALVIPTIAQTLGLRDTGGQSIGELVRAWLAERRLLLILDSFEQVVAAAADVANLLASSPGLVVVVTSRIALRVQGEQEIPVAPLALGGEGIDPAESPAVLLFVQRAQASRPNFEVSDAATLQAVIAICARLDGLPLAIELAATRVKLLPPQALLARLERRLPLLTGGARDLEARQQTMRDTLSWSYDLLRPEEQQLFQRLAVFVGGFSLEAAETICAAPDGVPPLKSDLLDELSALVDHSLVQQREERGEARFSMLQVIREYALEHLDASGEAEAVRGAHAAFQLARAETMGFRRMYGAYLREWLAWVVRDYDNLRAALGWARERQEIDIGLRMATRVAFYWLFMDRLHEGAGWLEDFLALEAARTAAGGERSREMVMARGFALNFLGHHAIHRGDLQLGEALCQAALVCARETRDVNRVSLALTYLADVAVRQGNRERGLALLDESLALSPQADLGAQLTTLTDCASTLIALGELDRAEMLAQQALALTRQRAQTIQEPIIYNVLALLAQRRGDLMRAHAHAIKALLSARDTSMLPLLAGGSIWVLALVAGWQGRGERAARLAGALAAQNERATYVLDSLDQAALDAAVASARAEMGEAAWAQAFAVGKTLTLDQVAAEALDGRE